MAIPPALTLATIHIVAVVGVVSLVVGSAPDVHDDMVVAGALPL